MWCLSKLLSYVITRPLSFLGQKSYWVTKPWFSLLCLFCIVVSLDLLMYNWFGCVRLVLVGIGEETKPK